jgi:hypothetical protein
MAAAALLALFVYMNFRRMGTDLPSDEATLVFSTIGEAGGGGGVGGVWAGAGHRGCAVLFEDARAPPRPSSRMKPLDPAPRPPSHQLGSQRGERRQGGRPDRGARRARRHPLRAGAPRSRGCMERGGAAARRRCSGPPRPSNYPPLPSHTSPAPPSTPTRNAPPPKIRWLMHFVRQLVMNQMGGVCHILGNKQRHMECVVAAQMDHRCAFCLSRGRRCVPGGGCFARRPARRTPAATRRSQRLRPCNPLAAG